MATTQENVVIVPIQTRDDDAAWLARFFRFYRPLQAGPTFGAMLVWCARP